MNTPLTSFSAPRTLLRLMRCASAVLGTRKVRQSQKAPGIGRLNLELTFAVSLSGLVAIRLVIVNALEGAQ